MEDKKNYWQNKISLWLHDPVCKVFDIPNHTKTANEIASLFGLSSDSHFYKISDSIAVSLTRSILPDYDKGGNIDFKSAEQQYITHPLVKNGKMNVNLSNININSEKLLEEIKDTINTDIGDLKAANNIGEDSEKWAEVVYNYLFFAFQRRLRNENIGRLGAIWDILPADTRIPDHSLWSHLGLVSAIGSSMGENSDLDKKGDISLVVFSLTPVQEFISKARKLRDYWTGSVLLSYLSFMGITYVMKNMGPDHIVYPSLHNQPLVDSWLDKEYHLGSFLKENDADLKKLIDDTKGIAAFPNKFVFLCSDDKVENVCKNIKKRIQSEWIKIADSVKTFMQSEENDVFTKLWDTQIEDFWKFSWASSKLTELDDKDVLDKLLPSDRILGEYELIKAFKESRSGNFDNGTARLYSSTHSLIQSVLAAGKMKPSNIRRSQNGEKCPLCGEREVLHNFKYTGTSSSKDYSEAVKKFWDKMREKRNLDVSSFTQVGEHERLCAVCSVKRFLPTIQLKDSLLAQILNSAKNFPSTTEMAANSFLSELDNYMKKNGIQITNHKDLIDYLHNADIFINDIDETSSKKILEKIEEEAKIKFTDKDKYYSVLLMDGDKMGDLINGETIEACWQDVIHEDLVKNIKNGKLEIPHLKEFLPKKRTMNPALHAMVSDALNNFARFGVQPAIKAAGGRLIYAGGDDVCAVLPLEQALNAAYKIQEAYRLSFAEYTKDGAHSISEGTTEMKKIGLHLGKGAQGISLSGAIVIAHHKAPLREVIQAAHRLLDGTAKDRAGRNALAIRLSKRSGGDRDFFFKWDAQNIFADSGFGSASIYEAFNSIQKAVSEDKISNTLLYKLQSLSNFFAPLLKTVDEKERICRLLKYELSHSGTSSEDKNIENYVRDLAGICFIKNKENTGLEFIPEAAIIAAFLGSPRGGKK